MGQCQKKMQELQLKRGVFQQQKVKPKRIKGVKENKAPVRVICWS